MHRRTRDTATAEIERRDTPMYDTVERVEQLGPSMGRVVLGGDPGNDDLLPAAVAAATFPTGTPDVFVHGEAGEVRSIRRHLLADRGLSREGASISPYWRRGHTDEAWREVKRTWLEEVQRDV